MIPTNPLQIQCNASTTLQHATFTSRDYWTVKSRAFDYISGPVDFTDIDQLQEKGGIIVLPSKLFWVSIWLFKQTEVIYTQFSLTISGVLGLLSPSPTSRLWPLDVIRFNLTLKEIFLINLFIYMNRSFEWST